MDAGDKLLLFAALGAVITLCFSVGACSYIAGECVKAGKTWNGQTLSCEEHARS